MGDRFDPKSVSPQLQLTVEQFYYREARLLDNRRYKSWLGLCDPGIRYVMPARTNPLVDNAERDREEMISVERELEGADSDGTPIRDEPFALLALRVERSFKANSWAENPPARTRRIVGNVEIIEVGDERLSALSNFHLFYARPGSGNFLYAGQRRDVLLRDGDDFRIANRVVVMDFANIDLPHLGLFF